MSAHQNKHRGGAGGAPWSGAGGSDMHFHEGSAGMAR